MRVKREFLLLIVCFGLGVSCASQVSKESEISLQDRNRYCGASGNENGNSGAQLSEYDKVSMVSAPKGVALVVHGLNLKPEKMDEIGAYLEQEGLLVIRPALSGHRGDGIEGMLNVSAKQWKDDFLRAYCFGKRLASKYRIPYYYVGYSLGAPLAIKVLQELGEEEKGFDKQIFMAPAISIKWYTRAVRALFIFGERYLLSSRSLGEYRSNDGTSMAAYRALFELVDGVERSVQAFKKMNKQTLVILHPEDEVIDGGGVAEMIRDLSLDHWRIWKVPVSAKVTKSTPLDAIEMKLYEEFPTKRVLRHLMVDRTSLGEKEWNLFTTELSHFVRN
ncbi:MAG: alpha/beta hydrolase [Oligoflexia bacterium]|nr:alpha/beta hydrolase [Oligoflexia bacterium]MBF0364173.1 alpha/beta hydrolase [Oligoflexia bacterium]